jgi:hypothetical protein
MPAGTHTFRLLSIPVNVGNARTFFADKELLSIGRDAQGKVHFYLTWTFYAHSFGQGPVMLSDSTDGVHWRTTRISAPDTCAPTTPGSHPVPAGGTLYVTWEQFDLPACTTSPDVTSGTQFVATVNVATATVQRVTAVARVHGAGDVLRFCGFADLGVIETAPGPRLPPVRGTGQHERLPRHPLPRLERPPVRPGRWFRQRHPHLPELLHRRRTNLQHAAGHQRPAQRQLHE